VVDHLAYRPDRVAVDEAHGLVRLEQRAAVQAHERLAEDGEFNGDFLSLRTRRRIGRGRMSRADVAIGEDRGVEFGRFARFIVVEPQTGGQLVGH